jgi:drug/metabolite transporter (DMT)-like permease
MRSIFNLVLFISYALCSGCGLIILKIAMSKNELSVTTLKYIVFSAKFWIGFFLYLCGFLLWMFILTRFKLNVAFPIAMSLFFIVSSLGSYFILGEPCGIRHIFGIAICFFGILLIGSG